MEVADYYLTDIRHIYSISSYNCFQMGKRCVVGGCGHVSDAKKKIAMHQWPKDSRISRQWDAFVKNTRADWTGMDVFYWEDR